MGRREENKRQKREALLAAGLSTMGHLGYDRASIEQIARDAGVARGTYYLYFPDKLALFRALIQPWFDGLSALVAEVRRALAAAAGPSDALSTYQHLGVGVALLGLTHQDAILLAFRESRRPGEAGEYLRDEERRMRAAVTAMTVEAADRGFIQVEDPALAVRVILGAVERLYFDVLSGEDLGEPTAVAEQVVRLFTGAMGLRTPTPG
jgi:AcrR family transcriptional regulator